MKKINFPLAIILSLLFIAACNKPEDENTDNSSSNSPVMYTMTNHVGKPIIVKVFPDSGYGGDGRYNFYLHLKAGEKLIIPYDRLHPHEKDGSWGIIPPLYRYYWATTDFTLSSWGTRVLNDAGGAMSDYPTFFYDPKKRVQNIDIYPYDATLDLKRWLNDIDGSATFMAKNAFDGNGKSQWETLRDSMKNCAVVTYWFDVAELFLNKRFPSSYFFAPSIKRNMNSMEFNLHTTKLNQFDSLGRPAKIKEIKLTTKYPPLPDLSGSDDKLYMILDNKPPYYLMVKQ